MSKEPAGNPLLPFIDRQGVVILDGGLATTLESYGHDLDDPLWSARLLLEAPESIRRAHLDFLAAGADCIATASYQASFEGFGRRGLSEAESEEVLSLSVELAVEARNDFWAREKNRPGRARPLVAASIGPYGAILADGSEYRGRYSIGERELRTFHRRRWLLLADSRADLMACETIPSFREACVLLELLDETPRQAWAWISFSCSDGAHLSDGSLLREAVQRCDASERVAAVGINCTAPQHIDSLIEEARAATGKPILVYPNQGEAYDARAKRWVPTRGSLDWAVSARRWLELGAAGIGGCCRVSPGEIASIRSALLG